MTNFNKNYTDTVDENATFAPSNNMEKFLAKMNGDDIDMPTPTNGMEYQLKRMAENPPSGGGGNDFLVTFTSEELGINVVCDKTYDEVSDAYFSGKFVRGNLIEVMGKETTYTPLSFGGIGSDGMVFFSPTRIASDQVSNFEIDVDDSNNISYVSHAYPVNLDI